MLTQVTEPPGGNTLAPVPNAEQVVFYDLRAWLYDLLVGSRLYHHLAWGMAPIEHERFARQALEHAGPGPILDAGCGSLLFTARSYRATSRELLLLDASRGMLLRAERQLRAATVAPVVAQRQASSSAAIGVAQLDFEQAVVTRVGQHRLLLGNCYQLPVAPQSLMTIFHFGVLHCLAEPERALAEFARALRPEGTLFLSCLVLARARGDAWLARLHRAGHVAQPRAAAQVVKLVEGAGYEVRTFQRRGSFLFLEAGRRR